MPPDNNIEIFQGRPYQHKSYFTLVICGITILKLGRLYRDEAANSATSDSGKHDPLAVV